MQQPIVIVGGGHAAAQLCASLQEKGQAQRIHLVCREAELPYQRPPLSKGFLKNPQELPQYIRPAAWYETVGIRVHLGRSATRIDCASRTLELDNGKKLTYAELVLATGTRPRRWNLLPDHVSNAMSLRTSVSAIEFRDQIQIAGARNLIVIGGGFVGLEVAATVRSLGKTVTLIEMAPRLMGRSVSSKLADHVRGVHAANGIEVRLNTPVKGVTVEGRRVTAIQLEDEELPCDLLLVAIGAEPEIDLARDAGLACNNGIVVDQGMATSDPFIHAIGDCTSFDVGNNQRLRLESIQNANDQARTLAARLAGEAAAYTPVPWFWSEQGSMRLQMVGLLPKEAKTYRREGAQPGSFSLFHFDDVRLACVESVNAPMDHMMARKLLEAGISPAPEQVASSDIALKTLLSA
jgi:3-phenylpropionate/trans-cinnamate dioxygenase ferredoxin reductase subunit